MNSTSINLLKRLREPNADAAWQRFIDLYTPLIFHWARQRGLAFEDASDLVQDTLMTLIVKLRDFEYDPAQRFRGWLRTITINRTIDFLRREKDQPVSGLDAASLKSALDNDSFFLEIEYQRMLVQRTMEWIKNDYPEATWEAAWRQLINAESASAVAQELNLTKNQVYLAKSRILSRLRDELSGLID